MRGCGAHVTLSRGGQSHSSSSLQAHARWGRTVDDDDSTAMTTTAQHGDGSTTRRWQHSMAMAAQQEVVSMQETELQEMMTAKRVLCWLSSHKLGCSMDPTSKASSLTVGSLVVDVKITLGNAVQSMHEYG